MPLRCSDASPRAAEDFLDPERGIAVLVTNITNPSAVWRKARLGPIEVTEGQWERCGTLHGRQPELLPLATTITAEQNPPAIRCDLRLRAPPCFFTKDSFQILRRVRSHAPDITCSISDFPIRDEQQALTIGSPGRVDRMVGCGVVIAIDVAGVFRHQTSRAAQAIVSNLCEIGIEMATVRGGNESDLVVIRRIARLDIDVAMRGQGNFLTSLQVELPQLERVILVANEDNVPTIV